MALDEIYKEVILDHYKNPRNKRELPGAELAARATTRSAATRSRSRPTWRTAKVAEIAFQGAGCSISQSSASMMTEAVAGQPVDGRLALAGDFRGMMAGEVEPTRTRSATWWRSRAW